MEQQQQSLQKLSQGQQDVSSGRNSLVPLKKPQDHSISKNHIEITRDPIYRNCFTLNQRIANWINNFFKCSDSQNSFVQTLDEIQKQHPPNISQEFKKLFVNKIVKIKIIQTSRLQLDSNVMHPFVKVHIIDKNTGCYLKRNIVSDQPMIYHCQNLSFYDRVQRKYTSTSNDIMLPFATNCCNFRQLGNSRGYWNQKFYINYPAQQFFKPDTLILFQILDFNHQALLYRDNDNFDNDNFFRVAWGYFRPVGMKVHLGCQKIELYRYKYNNKSQQWIKKSYIPSVYYDFLWNNHQKYQGYLTIQLNYGSLPKQKFIEDDKQYPQYLFEQQILDKNYIQRFAGLEGRQELEEHKINQKMLIFYRNRDICEIPKQLIYKLQSDKLGCYRAKFVGNKVFAACSLKKHTCIKVYSLENGQQIMRLKGHRQMIYSMIATDNQKYLVTGGSDHIARIWEIPQNIGQFIDEDQSYAYQRGQCMHTAAIYSISIIHIPLQDKIYALTCCYDGYLRLWVIDLTTRIPKIDRQILINNYQRSPQKVYPTSSIVYQSSIFFIGDSFGDIRIFDFARDSLNLRCILTHEQLSKDIIINIQALNKNHLLVQSSDNLIRHFQISNNKLKIIDKYVGAQFQQLMIPFTVSPDNRYLLAPSSNGKPYLWDITTGIRIDLDHLNLELKGPLTACDWHPKYNLVLLSGFVEYCPVFIFGNKLSPAQLKIVSAQSITN